MQKLKRFFHLAWSGLNALRILFFNILVLILVVGLLALWLGDSKPKVPARAALVLRPVGNIVDQLDGDPQQQAIDQLTGNATGQTPTKDLLDAIELAAKDARIEILVLDLNAMGGAGLTKLQQIGRAIKDFRSVGKKVVAVADSYSDPATTWPLMPNRSTSIPWEASCSKATAGFRLTIGTGWTGSRSITMFFASVNTSRPSNPTSAMTCPLKPGKQIWSGWAISGSTI